jgi:hypothetical protein
MARLILAVVFSIVLAVGAEGSCACQCVDGEMQPLCTSSIDVPPICAMTVCSLAPPSVAPIQPMPLPPLGTSECAQHQVFNPAIRRYEWRTVCQ